MTKYLRLYNKAGTLLKSSGNIDGSTGTINIENLFPETLYHEGDFLVSWVINGEELNKIPVPEFKTLKGVIDKTIIVYFSDINDENLIALKGDSAYKIALDNGFSGTQEEWLKSLKGEQGEKGDPGRDGVDITEGGSAYEIALAEGFQGTREEWLGSLKGEPGEPGKPGEKGDPGEDGFGVDGASAYEIALENGFVGNIQDFLDSLVGEPGRDGQDGNDGLSAYQIAKEYGYTGTEQEWLKSLKGEQGEQGSKGEQGDNGALVSDSGWIELPLLNGVTADTYNNSIKPSYKVIKIGGITIVRLVGMITNLSNNVIFSQIPKEYAIKSETFYSVAFDRNTNEKLAFSISFNGDLRGQGSITTTKKFVLDTMWVV